MIVLTAPFFSAKSIPHTLIPVFQQFCQERGQTILLILPISHGELSRNLTWVILQGNHHQAASRIAKKLRIYDRNPRSGIQRHFHASHVIEILYMPGHKAAHGALLQGIMLRVPGKITGQDIKGGVSQLLCRDPLPVEWMAPGDHDGRPEPQEGLLLKIVR